MTLEDIQKEIKAKPFSDEEHERLNDVVKDLQYLAKMQILEESKGGGTRDLDVVPISGIVMVRLPLDVLGSFDPRVQDAGGQ